MISQLVRSPFTRLRSSMKSEGLQRMIGSWDWVTSAHLPVGLNIAFAEQDVWKISLKRLVILNRNLPIPNLTFLI